MAKNKRMLAFAAAREVRRETFDGKPIVDAEADFTLIVRTDALKAAAGHEKDAANCILAKACAQQVGASIVAFFRRTAYLELPNSKGEKRVVRYILDKDAAAIVSAFDRGKSVRGEVMVTLKAPRKTQKLDYIRESTKRSKAKRRKAILSGEIIDKVPNNARFHKDPTVSGIDVRNGKGLVHNTIKKNAS